MKAISQLPENYTEYFSVDLQKDKKLAFLINGLALIITFAMAYFMFFFVPLSTIYPSGAEIPDIVHSLKVKGISLIVLIVLYMVLHELVHGIAMKICGTSKVRYGFTGMYAFAGSDDYYNKKAYIFIAMAPVVLWGIVLASINFLVATDWFWVIYFIQIINISGAAGDFYVTAKFARFPEDILVRDKGVSMTVYSGCAVHDS